MDSLIRRLIAPGVCLLISAAAVAAPNRRLQIVPSQQWSDVFAESDVEFHYTIKADRPFDGLAGWRFSINRHTVSRGEMPVSVRPGKPANLNVPLTIPPVKQGVIIDASLEVAVVGRGGEAEHAKTLWIFPRDPFADRSQWLEGLKITLFDPECKTADLFDKAGIPFDYTRNMASLDSLEEGLLIIGEDTSFEIYRGLAETITGVAASGVPVLCLAPSDGRLPMPGANNPKQPAPHRVSLRHEDVIRDLDKRVDSVAWPPDGQLTVSRFAILADRDRVVAEVVSSGEGWPWIEAHYTNKRGRLLLCGFGIVRQWDAGPAPRFLLAHLFERLTSEKPPPFD